MASETKIQWCDKTFNPWIGCTKVAPGCANCYAEAAMDKRRGRAKWGPKGNRSKTSADYWKQPRKWNREAEKAGVRFRVFCASLADVFEDWDGPIVNHRGNALLVHDCEPHPEPQRYVPMPASGPRSLSRLEKENLSNGMFRPVTMADLLRDLFAWIDATPYLDWLIVTKRPENIRAKWPYKATPTRVASEADRPANPNYRHNVWLLTSISDQATADKNIPELLKCRDLCPVLGVSAEPLLGPVDLRRVAFQRRTLPADPATGVLANDWETLYGNALTGFRATSFYSGTEGNASLDWVIAGGESGPSARDCDVQWITDLRDQCAAASVPFFLKQLGAEAKMQLPYTPSPVSPEAWLGRVKHPKGGDPSEWPADLQVRQFPQPTAHIR